MIRLVPVLLVDAAWPALIDGMERACQRSGGQYTAAWLHGLCRRGEAYLVVDGDPVRAGVVCQEQNWSGRTVLNVLAAAGKPYDAGGFARFAKTVLRANRIVFEGRKGWERLPGVRVVRHVYEMDI